MGQLIKYLVIAGMTICLAVFLANSVVSDPFGATTRRQIATFCSNGSWEASIMTLVKPSSMHSLQSSKLSPWSRWTAIGMVERLTAASINRFRQFDDA